MAEDPKWKRFEKLVAKVQQDLSKNADVRHHDFIPGKDSGKDREIDVSIRIQTGQFPLLIAISCKDYKYPVDVDDVGAFATVIEDVRANQGAMVAANGFTDGAKQLASTRGINLYRLLDAEQHDWQSKISIPAVCEDTYLKSVGFIFSGTGQFGIYGHEADIGNIILFNENNERLGSVEELLLRRWNSRELPMEEGEHVVDVSTVPVSKQWEGQYCPVKAQARIEIAKRHYVGKWPLKDFSGFGDEIENVAKLSRFSTEILNIQDIKKTWELVEDPGTISIKPAVNIQTYSSYLLDEDDKRK